MAKEIMSAEDKKWRGRDAARTLADAERIKNDPVLSKLAAIEAGNILKEHQENAKAMANVSNSLAKATKSKAPSTSKKSKK